MHMDVQSGSSRVRSPMSRGNRGGFHMQRHLAHNRNEPGHGSCGSRSAEEIRLFPLHTGVAKRRQVHTSLEWRCTMGSYADRAVPGPAVRKADASRPCTAVLEASRPGKRNPRLNVSAGHRKRDGSRGRRRTGIYFDGRSGGRGSGPRIRREDPRFRRRCPSHLLGRATTDARRLVVYARAMDFTLSNQVRRAELVLRFRSLLDGSNEVHRPSRVHDRPATVISQTASTTTKSELLMPCPRLRNR